MKKLMMIFVVMIMMVVGANTAYAKVAEREPKLSCEEVVELLKVEGFNATTESDKAIFGWLGDERVVIEKKTAIIHRKDCLQELTRNTHDSYYLYVRPIPESEYSWVKPRCYVVLNHN